VLDGFKVLSNVGVGIRLGALSVLIWLLVAAAMECMLLTFHLDLPLTAPLFVLALIQLSFIIPSTPGHVGVFQFAAVEALRIGYDVDPNAALSFALVTNVVSFVPPAMLGLWFIWRSGASLGRLVTAGREVQEEEGVAALTPGPFPNAGRGEPNRHGLASISDGVSNERLQPAPVADSSPPQRVGEGSGEGSVRS
jgi:hypothetical protein